MEESYTIIIIGEWNSENLGDNILCYTYESKFKELYPRVKILRLDVSLRLEASFLQRIISKILLELSSVFKCFTLLRKNYSNNILKNELRKYLHKKLSGDGVFFAVAAGGALIQDYFALPLSVIGEILEEYHVPIVYNAIGVGSLREKKSINLLKRLLNRKNVRFISARDNLEELNLTNKPIIKIPDIAICCSQYYNFSIPSEKYIGLGVIAPDWYFNISKDSKISSKEEYEQIMVALIQKIYDETKLPIFLFSNGANEDYLYAKYLYEKLRLPYVMLKSCPKNGQELVNLIANFTFVIANRLHVQIIAYSLDIPTFGILWDEKVKYWYEYINKDKQCCYLSEILNINFANLIDYCIANKETNNRKNELISIVDQFIANSFPEMRID